MVQLQFQDRTSQILAQVVAAMNELAASGAAAAGESAGAVREHLARMASAYTTEEQRRNHRGEGQRTAKSQDVTFF